jgi:hypothetical protein
VTALVVLGVLLWLFWPSKSKWHPFGGVFRHDKRTGQLTVAVTLPGRKKGAKKRRK